MATVRTADRTLSIFEAFESRRRPMPLSELAPLVDMPVSSCHGLVRTLLQRGYLYLTDRRRDYYPTRKLLHLAHTIIADDPFLERLLPVLETLRNDVRETVIVGARQGDAVLYLEVLEGPQTIRYSARVGDFKPLHSSAIGKTMLAGLTPAELSSWLAQHPLPSITDATITDPARLERDLAAGRQRGYFVTRGENVADVTAVATSATVNGQAIGIAVAGPSHRMLANLDTVADRVLRARDQISAEQP